MTRLPAFHRPSINARPIALAACAVLAAMLNAGAIGLATQASTPWSHIAELIHDHDPRRMAVVLIAAPDETTGPVGSNQTTKTSDLPAPTPKASHSPPASQPMASTAQPMAADEPPQPVLFYPFRDVDSPAFPASDWNLDLETLDKLGVSRLVFEVLVNDRGEVVGCTVLEPSGLAEDVRRDLEKRLSATPLLPALRAGQLVASVRRIELVVASVPPELPAHRP